MSTYTVSPAKFVTCICGKVCKGRAAFANHAAKCADENARSTAFVGAVQSGDWTAYKARYGWEPSK